MQDSEDASSRKLPRVGRRGESFLEATWALMIWFIDVQGNLTSNMDTIAPLHHVKGISDPSNVRSKHSSEALAAIKVLILPTVNCTLGGNGF